MNEAEPTLNLYIKPGCPWCVEAISFLKREGYEFREIDVISNGEKFREMQEISGQTYAPTMTYGDLVLSDFGAQELEAFLDQHSIAP